MAKRKRNFDADAPPSINGISLNKKIRPAAATNSARSAITIQIVAGSYDRVLHGITATIRSEKDAEFTDTFLFNAHTSAIRCLALSPPSKPIPGQTQKIILASGSTDERINLYHLSAHPPRKISIPAIASLTSRAVVENPQNRELGSLLHHASSVTALHFPNRSKLLSSAEDSTIAVTRTRDWSLLSTIKVPIPKPQGRPSGDTAPPGGTPAGINDFAVHPSLKLMISVGKGEKCMRLWNLVTGKKAGVLNFGREVLNEASEGRFGTGEGRKVAWGSTIAGEEFCVAFEWGAIVWGMDSKPRCKVLPAPKTKLHRLRYVSGTDNDEETILALSTENGKVLFYSTKPDDLITPAVDGKEKPLPSAKLIAQLGGREVGLVGRIKDFKMVKLHNERGLLLLISAGSDGSVKLWKLSLTDLDSKEQKIKQIGQLIGTYETGNRITCIEGFVMLPLPEGTVDEDVLEEEDLLGEENDEDDTSDSE